jgi:hypothetical protein
MTHFFIIMFHLINLSEFGKVKALIESRRYGRELQSNLSMIRRVELEIGGLGAHELLEGILFEIEDVGNLYRPLAVEFEIVNELFPDVFVIQDILEEGHDFGELAYQTGGPALAINDPPPSNDPATLGFDLPLLHKEYSPKISVLKQRLFSYSLAQHLVVIHVHMQYGVLYD